MRQTTRNSLDINADQHEIFKAFTNARALEIWEAPGDMTAKVHNFDLRVGGGYEMSLFYPHGERKMAGKTTEKEDKFNARFIELSPNKRIIAAINFETSNPDFAGEMTMEVTLKPIPVGTRVTILFENIPKGIRPADNEAGTISSLNKYRIPNPFGIKKSFLG